MSVTEKQCPQIGYYIVTETEWSKYVTSEKEVSMKPNEKTGYRKMHMMKQLCTIWRIPVTAVRMTQL